MANVSNMSLYAKLRDGRHSIEFPEGYFPQVTFVGGLPSVPTARWKKTNMLEGCWEWTIFFTRDMEIIPDYMNGYSRFHPSWYMLRFSSLQNSLMDIGYDSIYDLTSENYVPININIENGQKALTPRQYSNTTDNLSERFAMRRSTSMVTHEDKNIKQYIIPLSLGINDKPQFETILNDVRSGKIRLPEIN